MRGVLVLSDSHFPKSPTDLVLFARFDDCLKLGRRIDERPYKLPNPEITRVSSTDPVQLPSDSHLKGASSPQPGNLPTPKSPGALRSDLNVFRGKKIMLSNDLDLGSRLRGTIEDLISSGGGIVTGSVHKADIYICQYRDGEDYRTASRARKDVANLTWLYYLMTHNVWTSPLQRLLHYPVARGGLPGFRNYRISLSNYGGEARLYLENLIAAAGGEYTKTLRQDNTHLITARPHSEKCQAAREWNIHMVNHLWLEESYARWEEQSLANPRYSHFPARTNLGEVVGQTQIDRHALESVFFPPDHEDTSDDNEHAAKAGPGNDQEASAHPEATNGTRNEAEGLPFRESPTVKAANVSRAKGEGKVPKTPMASRLAADGKANETPSTTGSRSAKERAVAKLHEMAPDIALYEKEKRRAGGVVHGGRRSNGEGLAAAATKRSHSRESESEESELEEAGAPDRKKARRSKPPPASVKLLVTSYRPWIGQPRKEDEEKVSRYFFSFLHPALVSFRFLFIDLKRPSFAIETTSGPRHRGGARPQPVHPFSGTVHDPNAEVHLGARVRAHRGLVRLRRQVSRDGPDARRRGFPPEGPVDGRTARHQIDRCAAQRQSQRPWSPDRHRRLLHPARTRRRRDVQGHRRSQRR